MTTGCRMILDTKAIFAGDARLFADDPNLGPASSSPARVAMMGDILQSSEATVQFEVEAHASAPIERIEIRNGLDQFVPTHATR